MLRSRIIPCLLIHQGALVKTTRFAQPKYVGDPLNAVRIFNDKGVDELIVLDINATATKSSPDLVLIQRLASECRMPLCYGGGVKESELVERLVSLGVEKVALSSALVSDRKVLAESARRVGRQSLVAVIDIRQVSPVEYEVFVENGTRSTGLEPVAFARRCADEGAGEIVINSIDRDGTMQGYDLELAERVRTAVGVPLTLLGGAGSLRDMSRAMQKLGVIGVAAGSLFVFKGPRRAVLINYPSYADRLSLPNHETGIPGSF